IRVTAEEIISRVERHVITCYFTMVAMDEEGRPRHVTPLSVETSEQHRRWAAAQLRRGLRREIEERSLEIRQHPEDMLHDIEEHS
ncbi:MAG: acyl-CoA thioesterase, partial [Chloroflexales bacterium]